MNNYLKETKLLNYNDVSIQKLVEERQWKQLDKIARIKVIYDFVRDEIKFGYNRSDDIAASEILKDGYGQCNTKASLLMALLRATAIPNRIRGLMIDKKLQKGAITGVWYQLAPRNILHSWLEVEVGEQWYFLEGVIVDKLYLSKLQDKYSDCKMTFCGYGVYTSNFENPPIEWDLNHTYIQDKGITIDFGLFDTPDDLYARHQQVLSPIKRFIYSNIVRHIMNKNVAKIRKG